MSNFGGAEILQVADAVAREKRIPKDAVIQAMEDGIKSAARRKYGHEGSLRAEIDRRTGEIKLYRQSLIVDDEIENEAGTEEDTDETAEQQEEVVRDETYYMQKIRISDALRKDPNAKVGDIISEPLPPIDLGRLAAQSAKHVITKKVREVELEQQYQEFKDRIGEIVSGIVDKAERGGVTVKVGNSFAFIKYNDLLPNDRFRKGDRVRAYLRAIDRDANGPQILLSRTHKDFVAKLFMQEVPEIYDKIIEIKAIARDPGNRSKVAVYSTDKSIDPIGSCIGVRGARVQAVISELQGERIDVIEWSADPATMVVNALSPAEISKVVIDEDRRKIEVVAPEDQLSIAIGKRGYNIRLASEIVGWDIDIMTEAAESKRRADEFSEITSRFMSALDLEEILAQLLASEGYTDIKDIAESEIPEIAAIEGLDEAIASELITRAKAYLAAKQRASANSKEILTDEANPIKFDTEYLELLGGDKELALRFYENGVKDLQAIADLAELNNEGQGEIQDKVRMDPEQFKKLISEAKTRSLKDK
jgi:N utilization substance protein A